MAMASMLAGMAFANSGVGAAHALSHPLGSTHGVPHGEACAVVLPYVMEHALAQAAPKFAEIARALEPERTSAAPQDGVASVRRLFADIGLPGSLKALGIERERLAELVPGVMLSGSLRNNPRPLTEADVLALLQRAWEG
jgi:alcohol dehydrogenase class IV